MTLTSELDSLLQHFVKLYNEKRAALEEEQLHLNVGLNKIDETVEQVRRDVRIKMGLHSGCCWLHYNEFDLIQPTLSRLQ